MPFRFRVSGFASALWFWFLLAASIAAHATEPLRQQIETWNAGFPATPAGVTLHVPQDTARFYELGGFRHVWLDPAEGVWSLNAQGQALVEFITSIHREGLLAQDYHYAAIQQLSEAHDWWALELVLTDAYLHLGGHLLRGKVNPQQLNVDWVANPRQRDLPVELQWAEGEQAVDKLKALRPAQSRYLRLLAMLEWFLQQPAPDWEPLAISPKIEPGGRDARMSAIVERLQFWGDLPETDLFEHDLQPNLPEDEFTPAIEQAVRQFQTRHGLKVDGVIGRATFEQLNVTPAERARQLVANLERWRWLSEDFGDHFLLVNIADFSLTVYRAGEPAVRMPVIVGRHYRKTPVFSDRLRYLVFNPTWTVPFKLAVLDKLPEFQQDPDYLARLGFKVYPLGETDPVDPATIDWLALSRANFPYRLVQMPGPQNALGQVKFMFPNRWDVYLHDTPVRELFDETDRAFSSGCIRVSDSLALAEYLLADQGVTRNQIDEWLSSGEIRTVHLSQPLPIHIEYWTAWVDREGVLHFRKDVYNRDAALIAALANPVTGQPPAQEVP